MPNLAAPRQVTVTTTPTLIYGASLTSTDRVFRHVSAGVQVNLGIDPTVAANNIYPLLANEEFAQSGAGAIYGNVASGTCVVYIWESTN